MCINNNTTPVYFNMIDTISIFVLFLLLVGVLLFGMWSSIQVYAQKSSSATLSSPSVSKSISPELKAKMCDPSNPDLKVVNTTESRICGISKTVKPSLPSSATPTRAVSSSAPSPPPPPQQTTTEPTTAAGVPITPKKMATTNNISQGKGSTVAPVSHSTATKSSSSPSSIAPQIKAVNQHQQPQIRGIKNMAPQLNSVKEQQSPAALPMTEINGTAGINSTAAQNYTFAATSSVPNSDQVLYLGYHPTSTNPTNINSDSKHNDNHDSKSDSHSSTRSASDSSSKDKDTNNGSTAAKQKSSSTKPDRTDTSNTESSSKNNNSHNTESSSDHTTDSGSSSKDKKTKSDGGSSKENDDSSDATSSGKSSSILENDVSSVIVKSFNFKHSKDSDSSESSSIIENENDILPSVIVKSFNFR